MTIERTRWRDWLALAAARGFAPDAFWRLSLREWRALHVADAQAWLSRDDLNALAARFPDEAI